MMVSTPVVPEADDDGPLPGRLGGLNGGRPAILSGSRLDMVGNFENWIGSRPS